MGHDEFLPAIFSPIGNYTVRGSSDLVSVHIWFPDTVHEYGTRWALMWTDPFSSTHARIRARCLSTRSRPCTGVPVCRQFLSFPSSPLLCSDGEKWSNYVHSQRVNTTPFCAGTQAPFPEHQVWTAHQCSSKLVPGHRHLNKISAWVRVFT